MPETPSLESALWEAFIVVVYVVIHVLRVVSMDSPEDLPDPWWLCVSLCVLSAYVARGIAERVRRRVFELVRSKRAAMRLTDTEYDAYLLAWYMSLTIFSVITIVFVSVRERPSITRLILLYIPGVFLTVDTFRVHFQLIKRFVCE